MAGGMGLGGGRKHERGSTGLPSSSPASLMFKFWAVVCDTISAPYMAQGRLGAERGWKGEGKSVPQPSSSLGLLGFLRASKAMLMLLERHGVYRIHEDCGGRELEKLRHFAGTLL
ncbi:unnamed protein product, partial [Discosporangium mesarthrocarpum]